MTRYQPSRDETNDEALRSNERAQSEERYYDEHPQEFLDRVGEVGRDLRDFHDEFMKKSQF